MNCASLDHESVNRVLVTNTTSDFSDNIPRCYKDVYVNSFFPRTVRLWNSLPTECFL